jgi:glycosyltransferase involved in cell wall biosynthesis
MTMIRSDSNPRRVSIVVPVFNRPAELRQLLAALIRQSVSPTEFEILICDDGSTADIPAVVDELRTEHAPPIRYFRQHNQGPGTARNLGLANAGGAIVAFTDSDCLPDREWLAELIRPIETSRASMTGGLIDFRTANHLSGRCVNFLMSSMLGAGGARDPRSVVHMKYYPRAGNAAVVRDVALAAGGFPGHNHGEDIEFSDRILQLGARIEFVPTAIIVHNEKRSMKQVALEAFRKGAARIRLARVRGVHEWVHTLPALLVIGLTVSVLIGLLFPALAKAAAIPAALYAVVLVLISLHGGLVLKEVRAVPLLPVYAALMHFGYGAGYLFAILKASRRTATTEVKVVPTQRSRPEQGFAPLRHGLASDAGTARACSGLHQRSDDISIPPPAKTESTL